MAEQLRPVTPADRWRVHRMIHERRKYDRFDLVARVMDAATYVESFPRSYPADRVQAAQELHVFHPASIEWDAAFCTFAALHGIDVPALRRPTVGGGQG